jgi:hypothetical protein
MTKLPILAIAILLSVSAFSKNKDFLFANVGTIGITPPPGMKYTLGGYGERMNKPAEGVHDSIFTKVLILKLKEQKFAIVTLDLLGLPSNFRPELIKRIASKGWSTKNLMLLPSHSHGSLEMEALNNKNTLNIPQLGLFQPELLDYLISRLEKLMTDADRNYKPVKIGTKTKIIEGLNRNRRKDPDIDKDLIVTRIDLENGKPLAVLVNWTAHPTFIGGEDMQVSAEWPGYLQTELQQSIGNNVTAMYFNGAEGDMSTMLDDPAKDHYQKIQVYGSKIATLALDLYKEINPVRESRFEFNTCYVPLPVHIAHPSFMKTGGEEYGMNENSVKIIMDMLCPKSVEISSVRLGDLIIAGVPGEMTAVLGRKIKKALVSGDVKNVAIGGLANEWISYILDEKQYLHGEGYESSMSFYGPDLGKILTDQIISNARTLMKTK